MWDPQHVNSGYRPEPKTVKNRDIHSKVDKCTLMKKGACLNFRFYIEFFNDN